MRRIAIQGIKGSFHDIASHRYFEGEDLELVCCDTFEQVFRHLKEDKDAAALVAILLISHSIMCLPEDDWKDITEVNSHPVALMQCRNFLSEHDMKIVEVADTAGAAANISKKQLHGHAAICHKDAAKIYGMKVLQEGIETNKHNFTRFLVVCNPEKAHTLRKFDELNKASLVFTLPHEEGSLSAILSVLSFYKLNLTKIQSLPIIGKEWQYMFYIDLSYNDYTRYKQAINAITPLTKELKLLGEYRNGRETI